MKKQLTHLCFCMALILLVSTQASAQNDKGKGKKENQKELHKEYKQEKGNKNNNKVKVHRIEKEHKDNNGNGKHDKDKKDDKDFKDWSKADGKDGYKWNKETFKERNKIKNKEKVSVCHKFKGDGEPGVNLKVSSHALQAHLNHGDVRGECTSNNDNRYSDIFLSRRTEYYNTVQNTNEQVSYSQSVLVYALERLTDSRRQLQIMQNNNTPVQVVEQKKATVVELEQNVSLLETLLGVAVNVVANKLTN